MTDLSASASRPDAWDALRDVSIAIGLTVNQRLRLEPAIKLVALQVARSAVSQYQETHGTRADAERDELITALRQLTAVVEMWLASAHGESDVTDAQLASATHKAVDDANEVLARADAMP